LAVSQPQDTGSTVAQWGFIVATGRQRNLTAGLCLCLRDASVNNAQTSVWHTKLRHIGDTHAIGNTDSLQDFGVFFFFVVAPVCFLGLWVLGFKFGFSDVVFLACGI
jgi:hypothetical protein